MRLNCPNCACPHLRPEEYRWYEAILALFFLRPFRCLRCRTRFMRFSGVTRLPNMLALK